MIDQDRIFAELEPYSGHLGSRAGLPAKQGCTIEKTNRPPDLRMRRTATNMLR